MIIATVMNTNIYVFVHLFIFSYLNYFMSNHADSEI